MNKDIFAINKRGLTYKISLEEMEQFNMLMDHGLDMQTMIHLAFKQDQKIIDELNEGNNFIALLSEHAPHMENLQYMSKYLTLKQSLQCNRKLQENQHLFESYIVKKGIYPFFIFGFSYLILIFFIENILPQMRSFMLNDHLNIMLSGLKIIYTILFFLTVFFLCILFYNAKSSKFATISHPFFVKMKTYKFAYVFGQFMAQKISSQQCLELLCHIQEVRPIAQQLLQGLEQGKSLDVCMKEQNLDSEFIFYLQAGMKTQNVTNMLDLYCTSCLHSIENGFKRICDLLHIFSYSCVAVLVIVVYQVLLLPLNMLYQI